MFKLFEEIVSNTNWKDADELKANLKKVCERLITRDRLNFVVRNCSERMLKILQQKCNDLKIELKASGGLSVIQSLRHLTMKKVTKVHDDSELSMARKDNESSKNPFEDTGFDMDFELDATKGNPALLRRSTMIMPMTARAGRESSMSFKGYDLKRKQLSQ